MTATVPAGGASSSFERVRDALDAARRKHRSRGADQMMASCPGPVHRRGDRNFSLSITYDPSGQKTLINCLAGDAYQDVLAALGLEEADLYDERWEKGTRRSASGSRGSKAPQSRRAARKPKLGSLPARRVPPPAEPTVVTEFETVETYPYLTAQGAMVLEVARQERQVADPETGEVHKEKNFPQCYVSPATGRWVKRKPKDSPPVLWRLPDVAAALSYGISPVVLCEGERDSDRWRSETGMVSTTNPSGAGGFDPDHAALLADASEVWVVADHDRPGYHRLVIAHERLTEAGVARVRLFLPAVDHPGADVEDHFDAGFSVDEFVELSAQQARHMELVASLEAAVAAIERDAAEVHAWMGDSAEAPERAVQATRQWLVEIQRSQKQTHRTYEELRQDGDAVGAELIARASAATKAVDEVVSAARAAVGDAPDEAAPADVPPDEALDELADVVQHPSSDFRPQPARPLPMSRGKWRYDTGQGAVPRGVYTYLEEQWLLVAPLPYVRARIIRRNGAGRRCGLDYLVAAGETDQGIIIGHRELRDGSWANLLGLPLSDDDKIMKAASSAVRMVAEDVEEREAIPRAGEDGHIAVPVPESLPSGYLATAESARDDGLRAWADIIAVAAQAPSLALVLGASAVGPFLGAMGRQSHFVALYGDPGQGKSTALKLAGGVWGDSISPGRVVRSWDRSGIGTVRELGSLGCLPAVLDESGASKIKGPTEWGQLIYSVCEGASRTTAESRGPGTNASLPWSGVVISAGNGRITSGLGAGRFAGVARRVIDLSTPITTSADQAEALTGRPGEQGLLSVAFGHAGHAILDEFTVERVAQLVAQAGEHIGLPDGGNARTIARHLHSHVAGAAMLDAIAGTGTTLHDAALAAALDYLEQWTEPEHDADRVIAAVRDAVAREPAMWPTVSEYKEHRQPYRAGVGMDDSDRSNLPQHGVNRSLTGVRADDDSWVAVFSAPWHAMCEDLDVDEAVALRELDARGVLQVTPSRRRRREWTTSIKGVGTSLYKLALPDEEADDEGGLDVAPPAADRDDGAAAESPDTDTDTDAASASAAEATKGSSGDTAHGEVVTLTSPQPCVACGEPAGQTLDGVPVHLGGDCLDKVPAAQASAETAPAAEAPGESTSEQHARSQENPVGTYVTKDGVAADADLTGESVPCLLCGHPGVGVRYRGRVVHLRCWEAATRADLEAAMAAAAPPAEPVRPAAQPQRPKRPSSTKATPRRAMPAVFVTGDGVVLPDGTRMPLPERLDHMGDVAQIGYDLDLGVALGSWKGRNGTVQEWREAGQVWIDDVIAQRLGIHLGELPRDWRSRREAIVEATRNIPAVTDAVTSGWQIGAGGDHLGAWTRMWRDERHGVQIVLARAQAEDWPILSDDPAPDVLMRRLARFASVCGYPLHTSPQSTGIDWILNTRWREKHVLWPPIKEDDLPPPALVRTVEREISWSREPTAEEARRKYVLAFDRGGSHLAGMAGLELPVGAAVHHPEGCEFDPKTPGYWYVANVSRGGRDDAERGVLGADWRYPDPLNPSCRYLGDEPVVVSTPRLALAVHLGFEPQIVEAYTWPEHKRILDPWYEQVRDARTALDTGDPDDKLCREMLKTVYTRTSGQMAASELMSGRAGFAPHRRHMFVANAVSNLIRRVVKIGEETGHWPVAMQDDTIVYAVDEPRFKEAWPGGDRWWGRGLGQFKPEGAALMSDHQKYLTGGTYAGKPKLIEPEDWEA